MSAERVSPVREAVPVAQPAEAHLPAWKRPFVVLESPDFRHLWLGTLPGGMAIQMGMVTTGYVAYDLSGSAATVGLVALAMGVPPLFLGLFGGVVADRFPKRNVLLVTQSLQTTAAVIAATLMLTGIMQIWHLALVSILTGIGVSFNMPARHSFIAQIVTRERMVNAVALNMTGINVARIVGPAIAGVLIAVPGVGAGGVYALMSLLFFSVIVNLVRIKNRGEPVGGPRVSPLRSVVDGLAYVRHNPVVSTLLLLAFAPVLLGMPYQSLMPVFAEEVFDSGARGLGALMAANGVGALIGSLVIASLTGFARRGLLQVLLGMAFGASLVAFTLSPTFAVGMVTVTLLGVAAAGYQSLNNTLVMNNADPAYRGRVVSIYLLTFSTTPLAVVPIGFLADIYGAPLTIGLAGLLLFGIIGLVGMFHPTYRHIE